MLYSFVMWLVRVLSRLFFGIEYDGAENLPAGGGYIVVCNHRCMWDPFFIGVKMPRRAMVIMAKKELFKNKLVAAFIRYFGAFPVDRGKGDMGAVEHAVQAVKSGKVLIIFPEGTRGDGTELLRFKSGAAHIIAQAGADVLPMAVDFEGKIGVGKKVRLHIGKLIKSSELGLDGEYSLAGVKQATRKLRGSIEALLEAGR